MQENENMTKKLWFKRKTYGWGWTPCTWQGWAVVALYIVVVVAAGLTIDNDSTPREVAFTFGLPVVLATIAMIRISYRMGEKPRWQWGEDNKDAEAPKE